MIEFKTLQITKDYLYLIIDANVIQNKYYENVYIKDITIYTDETVSFINEGNGISGTPIYTEDISESQQKEHSWKLSLDTLDLDSLQNHLFYVVITADGVPSPDTPCSMDIKYTIGVTLDWYSIYREGTDSMQKVINNCCSIPKEFIDYILRLKALELSIKTSQYQLANDTYTKWFKVINQSYKSPCGCS